MTEMMEQQSTAFVVCVLCGVIIGFLISCFYALKKAIKMHNVWIGIFDLTFWLALCAMVILVMFYYNSGEIRLYFFRIFFGSRGVFCYYKLGCFQAAGLHIVWDKNGVEKSDFKGKNAC